MFIWKCRVDNFVQEQIVFEIRYMVCSIHNTIMPYYTIVTVMYD